jgi:hypothetical protein
LRKRAACYSHACAAFVGFFLSAIGFWPSGRGCLGDAIVSDSP